MIAREDIHNVISTCEAVLIAKNEEIDALKAALEPWAYRNLDDLPEFKGINTTTEYLAKVLFDKLAAEIRAGKLGRPADEISGMKVVFNESHVASAGYDGTP